MGPPLSCTSSPLQPGWHTGAQPAAVLHPGSSARASLPKPPRSCARRGREPQRQARRTPSPPPLPDPLQPKGKRELGIQGSQGSSKGQEPTEGRRRGRDEAPAELLCSRRATSPPQSLLLCRHGVTPRSGDLLQCASRSILCPTAEAGLDADRARQMVVKPKKKTPNLSPGGPSSNVRVRVVWERAGRRLHQWGARRKSPPKPFPRDLLKDTTTHGSLSPPLPKSHPALGRVPRAACPRTGQGCGFLAPPTSEQSEGNHKKTSETPLKSQNPNSPTLTLFKAHCSFQVLQ